MHDSATGRQNSAKSVTIIRLPTGTDRVERIRRSLSKEEGVSSVEVDYLRHAVQVEYDSDKVTLDQLRSMVRSVT